MGEYRNPKTERPRNPGREMTDLERTLGRLIKVQEFNNTALAVITMILFGIFLAIVLS